MMSLSYRSGENYMPSVPSRSTSSYHGVNKQSSMTLRDLYSLALILMYSYPSHQPQVRVIQYSSSPVKKDILLFLGCVGGSARDKNADVVLSPPIHTGVSFSVSMSGSQQPSIISLGERRVTTPESPKLMVIERRYWLKFGTKDQMS